MTKSLRINDPALFLLTVLATLLGLMCIFDAGYARSIASGYGAIPKEFKSQLLFLPIGLCVAAGVAAINGQKWEGAARWLWFVSLLSLLLPIIPAIGVEHNGASRWFKIGPAEIQPAEFIKVTVILYLAAIFAARSGMTQKVRPPRNFAEALDKVWVPKLMRIVPAIWVVAAILVIEKEPDMGTAGIVAVITLLMFFAGGVSGRSIILAIVLGAVGITALTMSEPYRMQRILHHANRWTEQNMDDTGYQTVQSELAMASGGPFGVGPGAGRAKHVLPAATTDFIAPTIGEEFGLVGMLGVLSVLGLLVYRCFALARKAPTRFGALVLSGVGGWIGMQTCLNVLMANASLPAIGVPLPFISSGGSSLVALWMGIGLCQAVLSPVPEKSETEVKRAPHRHRWRNRRPRLSRA